MQASTHGPINQVGGTHYAGDVQHWDIACHNMWCYPLAAATKYMYRYPQKGGLQDLQKALSYVDFMMAKWPRVDWACRMERIWELNWPNDVRAAIVCLEGGDYTGFRDNLSQLINRMTRETD